MPSTASRRVPISAANRAERCPPCRIDVVRITATRSLPLLLVSGALLAYGLFASLYWPFTAVSSQVWGEAYARVPAANTIALLVVTTLWTGITAAGTLLLHRTRRAFERHRLVWWALVLGFLGASAAALLVLTGFASVGVYNTVPETIAYPDRFTPFVVRAGLLALLVAAVLGVLAVVRHRPRQRRPGR